MVPPWNEDLVLLLVVGAPFKPLHHSSLGLLTQKSLSWWLRQPKELGSHKHCLLMLPIMVTTWLFLTFQNLWSRRKLLLPALSGVVVTSLLDAVGLDDSEQLLCSVRSL